MKLNEELVPYHNSDHWPEFKSWPLVTESLPMARNTTTKEIGRIYIIPKRDGYDGKTLIQKQAILANRYELRKILGKGGFGQVWKAYDIIMDEWVAIKIMKSRDSSDEHTQMELRILRTLPRDRFMNAYEYFHDGAEHVFGYTMEHLFSTRWTRLDHFVVSGKIANSKGKVESFILFLAIFLDLAKSLQFLHRPPQIFHAPIQSVVHGDLKPSNLFVNLKAAEEAIRGKTNAPAVVKICDFGLSSAPGEFIRGFTADYIAPRDLEAEIASTAVDIYSLGQTYLYCLHGKPIPPGIGIHKRIRAAVQRAAPFKRLGSDLADLILEMLSVDRKRRPQIEQVIEILTAFAGISDLEWQIMRILESAPNQTCSMKELSKQLLVEYYSHSKGRVRCSTKLENEIRTKIPRLKQNRFIQSAGRLLYTLRTEP